MKTENDNPIYKRIVTFKTIVSAEGITTKERTFVLIPVVSKPKKILTKEQIELRRSKKAHISKTSAKIPRLSTIEKNSKYYEELKLGENTIAEYRKIKLEKSTTPIKFNPKPSVTLTFDERNTRMKEHKKKSKAKRIVKNARVMSFKKNLKPYIYKEYKPYNSEKEIIRRDRQNKFWQDHESQIAKLLDMRSNRSKINPTGITKPDSTGMYKSVNKPGFIITVPKDKAIEKATEVANKPENEGARLKRKTETIFLSHQMRNAS